MSGWQPEQYEPRQQRPATPPQWRDQGQPPRAAGRNPWADSAPGADRGRRDEYGQLQPYPMRQRVQQPSWQPNPQEYWARPPYAPAVAPKSTGTGLLLGLLIPGVGCMYAGRTGIGVLILALWLLSIPLVFVLFIGVLTGLACWITSAVLGYTMTRDWNAARGIVS
jgi:TM2 domain-containing membrane protein YozV